MKPDKEGYLPVMRVMESTENQMWRKDYALIEFLLKEMLRECKGKLRPFQARISLILFFLHSYYFHLQRRLRTASTSLRTTSRGC